MAGRPKETAGGRPHVACTRLSTAEMEFIDRERKSLTVGMWLRWLIVKEMRSKS